MNSIDLDGERNEYPRKEFSFDTQCLFLAKHFLQDSEHTNTDAFELAQVIQNAVEAWFDKPEEGDGPNG